MTVYTPDMERTNIYLDDDTRAAAQHIRDRYAQPTDSAAIRYAIRKVAMETGWKPGTPSKPSRQRRQSKKSETPGRGG